MILRNEEWIAVDPTGAFAMGGFEVGFAMVGAGFASTDPAAAGKIGALNGAVDGAASSVSSQGEHSCMVTQVRLGRAQISMPASNEIVDNSQTSGSLHIEFFLRESDVETSLSSSPASSSRCALRAATAEGTESEHAPAGRADATRPG